MQFDIIFRFTVMLVLRNGLVLKQAGVTDVMVTSCSVKFPVSFVVIL